MGTSNEHGAAGPGAEAAPPRRLRRLAGAVAAARAGLPEKGRGDHLTILSGTGQNLAGLAIFVVATLAANILIARVLNPWRLGQITLATQFAFVLAAATRFGMDMAAVRSVAIDVGAGEPERARGVVARAAGIAAIVSVAVAAAVFAASGPLSRAFSVRGGVPDVFRAAALAIPFVALAQVYLGGTRGLKIMRHTLWIYWAGQPVAWIALMLGTWVVSRTAGASVLAYAFSWVLATVAAWWAWRRETRGFPHGAPASDETAALMRYGAPRAPAALLSQLLFWADYFVLARYVAPNRLGVYAAAVRVAQLLVLFLTAVNYMFSPYVADLHARGERERLDSLYKALTRWVVAGTVPLLLLLLVAPGPVLQVFGEEFEQGGVTALRILLAGQVVNVAVGSVGFILIMVGRTGWDLVVYAATFLLDAGLAFLLAPRLGAEGAAIAQAVTLVVANAARLYLVWRFVGIQPFTRRYARLAVPAAVAGGAMVAMHLLLADAGWPLDLAGTALVGTAVYAAVLIAAALTPGERAALRRLRTGPAAAG